LSDGWLASGYNTTPSTFRDSLALLVEELRQAGRDHHALPNAVATMWLYVTDRRHDAERMLTDVLAPMLGRPVEALRDLALLIGPPDECAERIHAFAQAGADRIFVWPLSDELRQLELFQHRVVPLASADTHVPPAAQASPPA
jgi:alkanesulfonate monooxygenase SsuD/methylene tetrahydromethanopterin reductase-like flavin-dependent oxidoreductase (luciferase family)